MLRFVIAILTLLVFIMSVDVIRTLRSQPVENFNVQGPGYNLIASTRTNELNAAGLRFFYAIGDNVLPQNGVNVSMSAFDVACTYIPPANDTLRQARCSTLGSTVDDIASCIHIPNMSIMCDQESTIRISYIYYQLVKLTVIVAVAKSSANQFTLSTTNSSDRESLASIMLHRPCYIKGLDKGIHGIRTITSAGQNITLVLSENDVPLSTGRATVEMYALKYHAPVPILTNIMINEELQAQYKADIFSIIIPGTTFDAGITSLSQYGIISLSVSNTTIVVDGITITCPTQFSNSMHRHVIITRTCDMLMLALLYSDNNRSDYWMMTRNAPAHPGFPLSQLQDFVDAAKRKGYMTHLDKAMHVLSIPNMYEIAWILGYRVGQLSS